MKRTILMALAVSMFALVANAQKPGNDACCGSCGVDKRVERLSDKLDLNDAQQAQLSKIFTDAAAKCKANEAKCTKQAKGCCDKDKKGAMTQLNKEISSILNAEQKAKFELLQSECCAAKAAKCDAKAGKCDAKAAKCDGKKKPCCNGK